MALYIFFLWDDDISATIFAYPLIIYMLKLLRIRKEECSYVITLIDKSIRSFSDGLYLSQGKWRRRVPVSFSANQQRAFEQMQAVIG